MHFCQASQFLLSIERFLLTSHHGDCGRMIAIPQCIPDLPTAVVQGLLQRPSGPAEQELAFDAWPWCEFPPASEPTTGVATENRHTTRLPLRVICCFPPTVPLACASPVLASRAPKPPKPYWGGLLACNPTTNPQNVPESFHIAPSETSVRCPVDGIFSVLPCSVHSAAIACPKRTVSAHETA